MQLHAIFQQSRIAGQYDALPAVHVDPDDTALIMYNSGTVERSKGVQLSHRNILASVAAFLDCIPFLGEDEGHRLTYAAFLPMAHVFEFVCQQCFMSLGCGIGYGHPWHLTDQTCRPHGDLKAIRPAIMVGVPRIFDTIRKGVLQSIEGKGALAARAFDWAVRTKKKVLRSRCCVRRVRVSSAFAEVAVFIMKLLSLPHRP